MVLLDRELKLPTVRKYGKADQSILVRRRCDEGKRSKMEGDAVSLQYAAPFILTAARP